MKISFDGFQKPTSNTWVLGVFQDQDLQDALSDLSVDTIDALKNAAQLQDFKGKRGTFTNVLSPKGSDLDQIVLLGLGDKKDLTLQKLEALGAKVWTAFAKVNRDRVYVDTSFLTTVDGLSHCDGAAYMASGLLLRSWSFDEFKTKKKDKKEVQNFIFTTPAPAETEHAFKDLESVAQGVFMTRDLVSQPPNVLYPETYAERVKELSELGVKVEVLDEKKMKKMGFNALLGVGQGSEKESKLVVMKWMGSDNKEQAPIAFVGKGVTFDTGGISLKPSAKMDEMKYDMGGSGVVVGLMKALASRKAKVNAVGVIGCVENMPSGNALKPADILTSLSGQTIEVLNTDAEGRLVLADALWYTQDTFNPTAMIDLATLTGAIVVALGHEYAGVFSNNDELAKKITSSGEKVGEGAWHMPMCEAYDRDIDSKVADVQNIGSGRGAGSATAAHFLERFVNKTPWAHIDIAGMAWDHKGKPLSEKGASGYGVRLLNDLVKTHFED